MFLIITFKADMWFCGCSLLIHYSITTTQTQGEGSAEVTSSRTTSTAAGGVRWPAADPPVSWLPNRRGKWLSGKQGFLLKARQIITLSRTWDWDRGARPPFRPPRPLLASRIYLNFIGEFPFVNRGRWPTRRSAPSKWCAVLGPWIALRWPEATNTFPSFKGTRPSLSGWVIRCCSLFDRSLWNGQRFAIFDCHVAMVA